MFDIYLIFQKESCTELQTEGVEDSSTSAYQEVCIIFRIHIKECMNNR